MVELFAPVLSLHRFSEHLTNSRTLVMVDSEAVEGALVKGYSSREDLSELVGEFWRKAAEINCTVYICRVPTDANPADVPSRPDKCQDLEQWGWERATSLWPARLEPGALKRAWVKS